jgi:hypothetical protein
MKSETVELLKELLKEKYSSKVQNQLVEGLAADEKYLVDLIERLNRTATHQLDWARSVLSAEKVMFEKNSHGN